MSLATSTSTDPVQTVVDLLDGTSESDWPGNTKPGTIEKQWTSTFKVKSNRNDPAAYVWSTGIGTQEQLSTAGETKDVIEEVGIDVWANDDTVADTIAGDVSSILEDYWNDRQANTTWHRIRPQSVDDRRAETVARRADHHVITVTVQLRREDSIGT